MRQNHSAYKEANAATDSLSLNEFGYLLFAGVDETEINAARWKCFSDKKIPSQKRRDFSSWR
jgi:hypothetical protein